MQPTNEAVLGIRHQHRWQVLTARPALQSAHDTMRWDVGKSRIVSVNACSVCGELQRDSVRECSVDGCREHRICERPHR